MDKFCSIIPDFIVSTYLLSLPLFTFVKYDLIINNQLIMCDINCAYIDTRFLYYITRQTQSSNSLFPRILVYMTGLYLLFVFVTYSVWYIMSLFYSGCFIGF